MPRLVRVVMRCRDAIPRTTLDRRVDRENRSVVGLNRPTRLEGRASRSAGRRKPGSEKAHGDGRLRRNSMKRERMNRRQPRPHLDFVQSPGRKPRDVRAEQIPSRVERAEFESTVGITNRQRDATRSSCRDKGLLERTAGIVGHDAKQASGSRL
jgi:hypothetical protein